MKSEKPQPEETEPLVKREQIGGAQCIVHVFCDQLTNKAPSSACDISAT
jgi:hypothetical protein